MTEATDEINRTIDENLTDLKSLEQEIKATGGEQVVAIAPLEKKASTRSLTKKPSELNVLTVDGAETSTAGDAKVEEDSINAIDAKDSPGESTKKLHARESSDKLGERNAMAKDGSGEESADRIDGGEEEGPANRIDRPSPEENG